jgi:hypothetical protein
MNPHPYHPCAPIPRLGFLRHAKGVLLCPPTGTTPAIMPALMPKIPGTLIHWQMLAAEAFFQDYQRHLAFVLLYSPSTGHWHHELPRQTCRSDGVSWTLTRESLPTVPEGHFFVGSFQSHPSTDDAYAAVPRISGLHFVHHPQKPDLPLKAVLRCDKPDQVEIIRAEAVIAHDHNAFLHAYPRRLQLT